MPGEIFGVVGRNGSGKSTLLKILSRVVDPTEGSIKINGKIASLLEVGTGFHPELTGRENIFFNGSMLGMSRKEIIQKFNQIVEFSEVEKFIDTPVKFYSSGMYVRLAFSVAVHLESDILILDEVLAVGDANFQKKSMRKILSTMQEGRTVLFVSHSMDSVRKLCSRGILLDGGKIEFIGSTEELVDLYSNKIDAASDSVVDSFNYNWVNDKSLKSEHFIPENIYITDNKNNIIKKSVKNNIEHYINLEINVLTPSEDYTIGFMAYNEFNNPIYVTATTDTIRGTTSLKKGKYLLKCPIPKHLLNNGQYKFSLFGGFHNKQWVFEPDTPTNPSVTFIIDGGLSESDVWKSTRSGSVAPVIEWGISKLNEV